MKEFIVSQDGQNEWRVSCEKVPGYIAKGKTQQEAIEKMKQALKVYYPCGECKGSD